MSTRKLDVQVRVAGHEQVAVLEWDQLALDGLDSVRYIAQCECTWASKPLRSRNEALRKHAQHVRGAAHDVNPWL